MSTSRYGMSLTSQFYFCGIPFRIDTATNCPIKCTYCFSSSRGGFRNNTNRIIDIDDVKKRFDRANSASDKNLDVSGEFIKHRTPLHFGGMSDPFGNDFITKHTCDILSYLKQYNYPIVLSTKNTSVLCYDEIIRLLKSYQNIIIQISFSTINDYIASILEPFATPPKDRINAIRLLSGEGIKVMARVQPIFPSLIDSIAKDLIPTLADAGIQHVVLEFLKVPVEKSSVIFDVINQVLGWGDLQLFERYEPKVIGREWLLSINYRWESLQLLVEAAHTNRLTVGLGDYGLNHLSDSDCCCGIDRYEGFLSWFKPNFSNIIKNSDSEYIYYDSLEKYWYPQKSINMYVNSNSRPTIGANMLYYLRDKWNRPNTVNAPNEYLGILWQGDYDKSGNCVYAKTNTQ